MSDAARGCRLASILLPANNGGLLELLLAAEAVAGEEAEREHAAAEDAEDDEDDGDGLGGLRRHTGSAQFLNVSRIVPSAWRLESRGFASRHVDDRYVHSRHAARALKLSAPRVASHIGAVDGEAEGGDTVKEERGGEHVRTHMPRCSSRRNSRQGEPKVQLESLCVHVNAGASCCEGQEE